MKTAFSSFLWRSIWQKERKVFFSVRIAGHEEAKWLGQCPVCKEWNTFAEEKVSAGLSRGTTAAAKQSKTAEVVPLSQISARDDTRMLTGMKELDRGAWRRYRLRFSRSGRRGPGDWKINPVIASVSEAVGIKKNFIYFRRGVADSDQIACKSYGKFYRSYAVVM